MIQYLYSYIFLFTHSLDLELKDASVAGIGEFVVHKSDLQLSDLSFDVDISVPQLDIGSGNFLMN